MIVYFGLALAAAAHGLPACAQRSCRAALAASDRLSEALQSRDTLTIRKLTAANIGYGHSNGWIETRSDMLRHLYDGTLQYQRIRLLDTPSCVLQQRTAIIRHRIAVAIEMTGTALEMNLAVMQAWQYRRGKWVLIARQSCKIP